MAVDFTASKFKAGDRVRFKDTEREYEQLHHAQDGGSYVVTESRGALVYLEGNHGTFASRLELEVAANDNPGAISEHQARKNKPIMRGCFDYFPDALMAVAEISRIGNEQHHPGAPLHWEKDKSADHADCCVRHLLDRGTLDTDGAPHSGKAVWRALANFQTELEAADPELRARRQAQRDAAARGAR